MVFEPLPARNEALLAEYTILKPALPQSTTRHPFNLVNIVTPLSDDEETMHVWIVGLILGKVDQVLLKQPFDKARRKICELAGVTNYYHRFPRSFRRSPS